jgi:hypothetical protein
VAFYAQNQERQYIRYCGGALHLTFRKEALSLIHPTYGARTLCTKTFDGGETMLSFEIFSILIATVRSLSLNLLL